MKELTNVIKIRGKIGNIQLSSKFLKDCFYKRVTPHSLPVVSLNYKLDLARPLNARFSMTKLAKTKPI